jgi:hypothetical protein
MVPQRPNVISKLREAVATPRARRLFDRAALIAVLAVAAGFTGYNIFGYPHYELDEGTYVGSAWTMMSEGHLFYYTYTYAHPPLGWFQIGLWSVLTGGFDRFGMSINSGRALMLVLTILSTLLIFLIVRRGTGRVAPAALAGIAFSVSPLAIGFHRQVYLDNIGTCWMLLSLLLLQSARGRLGRIVLSAVVFGIAFLTKEVFAAMLPGMVLGVALLTDKLQRRFAVLLWSIVAVSFVSLFVLLAILKDELLPPGTLWSSPKPHVSLIQTYFRQAGRGGGGILDRNGEFWSRTEQWWHNDPLFIGMGVASLGVGLLIWRWDRFTFFVSVLTCCFILFLGRGGVVLYYYVIPVLAFMAVAIGLVSGHAMNLMARWRPLRQTVAPAILAATIVLMNMSFDRNAAIFSADATSNQREAAQWIVRNLPHSSLLITDSYAWQDLRSTSMTDGSPFPLANYYWPTFSDPVLVESLLNDNWQKIDYLLVSSNTLADANTDPSLAMLKQTVERSDVIREFKSGGWTQWIMRVRKVHRVTANHDPMLVQTWRSFVAHFIVNGRVVDPKTGATTSKAQASAMLQALYMDDRPTFDALWSWSQANLQVRPDGLLISSLKLGADGSPTVVDGEATTSADEDTALALLLASRFWNAPEYQWDTAALLHGIWKQETVELQGQRFIVAGSWARGDGVRGINEPVMAPSSFAPYAYRIFAQFDPSRPWLNLVDSTYSVLTAIRGSPYFGGPEGLIPTYFKLDSATATPRLVGATIPGADEFTIDSAQVLTRLTIDYLWSHDERARQAIRGLGLPRKRMQPIGEQLGGLSVAYGLDGSTLDNAESIAMYANVVPSLLVTDDINLDFAQRVFSERVLRGYTEGNGQTYWGSDPDDLQAQATAWFACAMMDGSIANLWAGEQTIDWAQALDQR